MHAANARSPLLTPGVLKILAAESLITVGVASIKSVRRPLARAGSIAGRLLGGGAGVADGGAAWRGPLSRTANVVTPPDWRFPELAAESCATALSGEFPIAFFPPPLKATHAPPAASSTTRPIAAGP